MSTLFVDPAHMTPISEPEPVICRRCLKKTARWLTGKVPEVHPECSFCFLYKTDWGKQNAPTIKSFISLVESEMKRTITGENGDVLEEEADRIMVAIRQTSAAKLVFHRLRKTRG